MLNKSILPAIISCVLFTSCGGGGVSKEFTREINEFETALTNTGSSFSSVIDSVKSANVGCDSVTIQMKVPDSLISRVTDEYAKKLDSVKSSCGSQHKILSEILTGLIDHETGWYNETNRFTKWKDQVLKGEIDIETAKRDLEVFRTKLEETATKSDEAYEKLASLKRGCIDNLQKYNSIVIDIPNQKPEKKKRKR